ncbi:neuropilin-2-like isoform X2 [Anneissia japonica]|uniref:neuropilin-2-like isoform X2 n=1 Tax=Anneissia japonica TaxID=1529436 RepID=UPI0014255402|nr:neuropilin-2-like isoform X2 [Anneissia japonica]
MSQSGKLINFLVLQFVVLSHGDQHCSTPLGMEDGTIPDNMITSSSWFDEQSGPSAARLNGDGGWASYRKLSDQWVQVDLNTPRLITGIVTQGNAVYNEFVMSYYVHYSMDGKQWKTIRDSYQNAKLFDGNLDHDTPVQAIFIKGVRARFIRIQPYVFHGHPSMRFELLGCVNKTQSCWSYPCKNGAACSEVGNDFECTCLPGFIGKTCKKEYCSTPLGLESESIPDSQLSASSYWSGEGTATYGRLNAYGWAAASERKYEWFGVDLGHPKYISGIITQGHSYWPEWTTSYNVLVSNDSDTWTTISNGTSGEPQIFKANVDKNSQVKNFFTDIVMTRYVRIRIEEFKSHPSLRLEILGCEDPDATYKPTTRPLTTSSSEGHNYVQEPCNNYPCENGGTCQPIGSTSFSCQCPDGFTGYVCQDGPGACESNPCLNSGWCTEQGTSFKCACLAGFTGKRCQKDTCVDELGMDKGTIPDSAITASSYVDSSRPSDARPKGFGWMPSSSDYDSYIQVDLSDTKNVSAVVLMDYPQWSIVVTEFQISYSTDGVNWQFVTGNNGEPLDLLGLEYGTEILQIHMYDPLTTRYIRIHPTKWIGYQAGMRFELLGCELSNTPSIVNDLPPITPATATTIPRDGIAFLYGLTNPISNDQDTAQVVRFDYKYFDYGDSYEPSTGVFTSTIPGMYHVFVSATSTNPYLPPILTVMHNNKPLNDQLSSKPSSDGLLRGELGIVIRLDKGDRVWVEIPAGTSLKGDIVNSSLAMQLLSQTN